ncbi:MAG: YIP1 family protein [Candidatus Micrarchaeota archaeon]
MIIVDELKEGFNIMLHPKSATQKERKIGEALAFYYKMSIIPLILYIILALVVPPKSVTGLSALPTGFLSGLLVIGGILALLVIIPISLFVTAFIYQIFGKLFKVFSNPYSNTFTATVYGIVPTILFYWLSPVPLGSLVLIIFEIWAFIVMILALANQQKTSALKAFAVIIVTGIIMGAIVFLIGLGTLFPLATTAK